MFTGILYTHIFYALGGSEMPNGQNLRPIAAPFLLFRPAGWEYRRLLHVIVIGRSLSLQRPPSSIILGPRGLESYC